MTLSTTKHAYNRICTNNLFHQMNEGIGKVEKYISDNKNINFFCFVEETGRLLCCYDDKNEVI